MKQRPLIYYSESQKALMWERWRARCPKRYTGLHSLFKS